MLRKTIFIIKPHVSDEEACETPTPVSTSSTGLSVDTSQPQVKRCQCNKSRCLKLYCQCFHSGKECGEGCGCVGCQNNPEGLMERGVAIFKIIHKYKSDYVQKFKSEQTKGCSCRKSHCRMNYCECYLRGKECGSECGCKKCKNGGHGKKL